MKEKLVQKRTKEERLEWNRICQKYMPHEQQKCFSQLERDRVIVGNEELGWSPIKPVNPEPINQNYQMVDR